MSKLFNELKRRNVFKVSVAYVAVSWALVQAADILLPTFGAPEGFLKGFYIVLGLGFPIAVLLAWAYEVTPDGVKKTGDVKKSKSVTPQTGHKINYVIIGGLALAVGLLLYDKFAAPEDQIFNAAEAGETSIAVLPFTDLSPEGDQEYFSDGMTEEILNVLVKVPDLKVAGRTSSFAYKGRNENLTTIGEELNVSFLVEGSVRKSENRLRITAQLIRASDGFHLWSDTYDREMTDIFEIQDEISRAIADALSVSLGLEDINLVPNQTDDLEAYEGYLRALGLYKGRGFQQLTEAIDLLNAATLRDPDFAPGWAMLGRAHSVLPYYIPNVRTEDWEQNLTLSEFAAKRALSLDPNSALAYSALGTVYTERRLWVLADENHAKAVALDPDNGDINQHYAEMLEMTGLYSEALEYAAIAAEVEPLSPIIQNDHGYILIDNKRYEKGFDVLEKAWMLDPNLFFPVNNILFNRLYLGQFNEAHDFMQKAARASSNFHPDYLVFLEMLKNGDSMEDVEVFVNNSPLRILNPMSDVAFHNARDYLADLETFNFNQFGFSNPNLMVHSSSFLRGEPKFKELVRRAGLYDFWVARGWPDDCQPIGDDDFECTP